MIKRAGIRRAFPFIIHNLEFSIDVPRTSHPITQVMAITALNSAATGLRALSTRIDVVANNLANAETTAFKRSRANFEDLMYLQLKQPGTTNTNGDQSPSGIYVGLGTRISNTQLDTEQGSME